MFKIGDYVKYEDNEKSGFGTIVAITQGYSPGLKYIVGCNTGWIASTNDWITRDNPHLIDKLKRGRYWAFDQSDLKKHNKNQVILKRCS